MESTLADANGIILQDIFSIDFLSNCRREVTRWTWTQDKRYLREGLEINGEPIRKSVLEPFSGMTTRAGYYRHAPGIITRDGRRLNTLVIWPPERARRASQSDCFNPMWYLTGHMTKCLDDLVERLVFLYRRVKNDGAPGIIAMREGNIVILELKRETVLNRHYFSLAQGGNMVEYFGRDQDSEERREWTYEQKGGAWVPKTFIFNFDMSSPEYLGNTKRTWKVTFIENIVNEPIPVSQFSLKVLGYKVGEQLSDRRTNLPPIYDGTRTWEERISREFKASSAPAPYKELPLEFAEPLLGKPLPEFSDPSIDIISEQIADGILLICFFDMNQRPSRNCIMQLSKRTQELKAKGVEEVVVHASNVDRDKLDVWMKKNNILFPVGMIEGKEEKTRFKWGVKSLPWLILTDREHKVVAEGFAFSELGDRIDEVLDNSK